MASEFTLKDASTIRDDILRTYRAGLIKIGVENPNVTPGSDIYILAQSVGDQLEIAMANAQVKADAQMPDTAEGADLDRELAIYGLARRAAGGSSGNITLSSSAACAVVVGSQLVDGAGLRYQVTTGGLISNGGTIAVEAIDTGEATNLVAGATLRWVAPPAFSAATALVATGGLTGGTDAENDDTARARLYERLRTPPAAGNWEHVAELAEASTTSVQKAFVYPCISGPGSLAVAVCADVSSASKTRMLAAAVVDNTVAAYLAGKYPEHIDQLVTGVQDVPFDMSVGMTLPASPKASPAGPGGGWTDGSPWPVPNTTNSYGYCDVVAVTSSTVFQVRSETAPTVGVTQVAWLSPVDWTVYTATVIASSTISTYVFEVTLDRPFTSIAIGHYVSPNAVNVSAYFDAVLTQFALMGPGEKLNTSDAAYVRAYRHPTPPSSWPCKVDGTMLRALTNAGDEVLDVEYLYRTSSSAPAVPTLITTAPNIYVPNNIAFYQKT